MKHKEKTQRIIFFFAFVIISIGIFQCTKKIEEPVKEKAPQISVSTALGGDWSKDSTWQQANVPTIETDVNVSGKVIITGKAECLNLMIDCKASLEVMKNASLVVKHHIINEGTIINNGEIIVREQSHK